MPDQRPAKCIYISLQTSATLTFAIYMLTQHPHVVRRLRGEVLDTIGPDSRPTFEQVKEMAYLRAFIDGMICYLSLA